MKKPYFILFFSLLMPFNSHSQSVFNPVKIAGFNEDIIANGGPASNSENQAMLSTSDVFGGIFAFYTGNYRGANNQVSQHSGSLPDNGEIKSISHPYITYQLEDYSLFNALIIDTTRLTGTLTFAKPERYDSLSILACSANQKAEIKATIHFTDGSSTDFNFTAHDWYFTPNYAINNLGRLKISDETFEVSASGPRIYDYRIGFSSIDRVKKVSGITFRSVSRVFDITQTAIFAVSGHVELINSLNISGFNEDVIANGFSIQLENQAMLSTTCEFIYEKVLYSEDYMPSTLILPIPGLPLNRIIRSAENPMIFYQLNSYSENNVLLLPDRNFTDTLIFPIPVWSDKLAILGCSLYGQCCAMVNFIDGSSSKYSLDFDYCNNPSGYAIQNLPGVRRSDEGFNNNLCNLYDHFLILRKEDRDKLISSIVFKNNSNGFIAIFAITGMDIPETPVISKIENITESSFIMHWTPVPNINCYMADVSLDSTFSNEGIILQNLSISPKETARTFSFLPEAPVFYVRMRAKNPYGEGEYSSTHKIKTPAKTHLSVSPSVLTYTEGHSVYDSIFISANGEWTARATENWLKNYTGAGNDTLVILPVNTNKKQRSAELIFSCGDATDTVKIYQAASVPSSGLHENFEGKIPEFEKFACLPENGSNNGSSYWKIGTQPYIAAMEGKKLLKLTRTDMDTLFESRLITIPLDFSEYEKNRLFFYTYDNSQNSKNLIQIQASEDEGMTWHNLKNPVFSNICPTFVDWMENRVDLSEYAGKSSVNLALLIHQEMPQDLYIDDISIAGYIKPAPEISDVRILRVFSNEVLMSGTVIPSMEETKVSFEYRLKDNYAYSVFAEVDTIERTPFKYSVNGLINNLISDTTYYIRLKAENKNGIVYSSEITFKTLVSSSKPSIYQFRNVINNGKIMRFYIEANTSNDFLKSSIQYGKTASNLNQNTPEQHFLQDPINFFTISHSENFGTCYFRAMVSSKTDTVYSNIIPVTPPKYTYDTLINRNTFFKGSLLHAGVDSNASFGSNFDAPSDMLSNRIILIGKKYVDASLGLMVDLDGWKETSRETNFDYLHHYPHDEGWSLQLNGVNYCNNKFQNLQDIGGSFNQTGDSGDILHAIWKGMKKGLEISHEFRMPKDSLFITIDVSLHNNTDSTLHNIFYSRNINPTNDCWLHENTYNSITYQNPDADDMALVSATGLGYNSYLGLAADDKRARVCYDPFDFYRSADYFWNTAENFFPGNSAINDDGLALTFKIDSLAAGSCTSFTYAYIFKEASFHSALSSTSTNITVPGQSIVNDTLEITSGSNVSLVIHNGEIFEWTWSPFTGLNATTGTTVTALNVKAPITYTAAGKYLCFTKNHTITLMPKSLVNANKEDVNKFASVYPNPVNESFILSTNYNLGKYYLVSSGGMILLQGEITDYKTTIKMKEFPKGIYLLRIISGNKENHLKIIHN